MSKLSLTQGGVEIPVLQYAMPIKGNPVALQINGEAVEGRVTNARNRIYTYFAVRGGEFYVAGELAPDQPITFAFPEGFVPRTNVSRTVQYEKVKELRAAKKAEQPEGEKAAPKPRGKRKTPEQEQAAASWGVEDKNAGGLAA